MTKGKETEELFDWPCQHLHGGTGAAIYSSIDGRCQHPECHPSNDDRDQAVGNMGPSCC